MSQQQQQTAPAAPESPALVVSSNVTKYAMKKKKVLSAEETELYELTQSSGVTVDQEVFKILVDLLKMNVAPQAVFQTLKAMCAGQRLAESGVVVDSSIVSNASISVTTATPAETREDDSKAPKPPVAAPPSGPSRAPRVSTKMVVYGPGDASAAHTQVRSKGVSQREASGQRVQRQPSATRGTKTKSSGSSSSSSQINST